MCSGGKAIQSELLRQKGMIDWRKEGLQQGHFYLSVPKQ
jgi:hypothetical protein